MNRRLAMILIDNSVELALKTYLGLPSRVTGIRIAREKMREISESFPRLLDAFEQNASDLAGGIDFGQIEWYHRLRNELYHEGNGLTVERQKVEVYAEYARVLFKNLFGVDVQAPDAGGLDVLGAFFSAWSRVEAALKRIAPEGDPLRGRAWVNRSIERQIGSRWEKELDLLRQSRNQIAHGQARPGVIAPDLVQRVEQLAQHLEALPPPTSTTSS